MPQIIQCPECEFAQDDGLEIVKLQEEFVRVTYAVELSVSDAGIVSEQDFGETERETLDADRDSAKFRCDQCYFETDDLEDFLADEVDTEDEDC